MEKYLFYIVTMCSFICCSCFADTVEIIQIRYRNAGDALKIVENLITQEGSVTMDERTNSLVVKDSEEPVARILQIMQQFDKAIEQAKISIRFNENEIDENRPVSIKGGVHGKNWKITSGAKSDGVDIRVKDINTIKSTGNEYFINVASGSPAYIVTGKSIPYHQKWVKYNGRHPVAMDTVVFENVETGFEITPVIRGNSADLKIVPRISDIEKGGIIRYSEAVTVLDVLL